jgi:hypothetical protein
MDSRRTLSDPWLAGVFSAKAAASGGVIRRNRHWVENEIGRDRFMAEVRARGFHLLETGNQFIVICHPGHIHLHF